MPALCTLRVLQVPGGKNLNNYANVQLITSIAVRTGVDAVWPGWCAVFFSCPFSISPLPSPVLTARAPAPALPHARHASPLLPAPACHHLPSLDLPCPTSLVPAACTAIPHPPAGATPLRNLQGPRL